MESAPCDTQPRHHQPWEAGRCSFLVLGNLLTFQTRSWQKKGEKPGFEYFGAYLKCRSGFPSAALLFEGTPIPIDFFFLGGMFYLSESLSLLHPQYLKVKYKLIYLQWSWHCLPAGQKCYSLGLTWRYFSWFDMIVGHLKSERNVLLK